jgi:hypothetical protein
MAVSRPLAAMKGKASALALLISPASHPRGWAYKGDGLTQRRALGATVPGNVGRSMVRRRGQQSDVPSHPVRADVPTLGPHHMAAKVRHLGASRVKGWPRLGTIGVSLRMPVTRARGPREPRRGGPHRNEVEGRTPCRYLAAGCRSSSLARVLCGATFPSAHPHRTDCSQRLLVPSSITACDVSQSSCGSTLTPQTPTQLAALTRCHSLSARLLALPPISMSGQPWGEGPSRSTTSRPM